MPAGRFGPAAAHRPRRLLRPAGRDRRAPGGVPVPRRAVAARRPQPGQPAAAGTGHPGLGVHRAGSPADLGRGPSRRAVLRLRRAGQRGGGPRHGALADPPGRPGPARWPCPRTRGPGCPRCSARPARWPGSATPAAPTRWRSRRRCRSWPRPTGAAPARAWPPGRSGLVSELAAAPDGSSLAVAARDGRLLLVDVASGAVSQLAESGDGAVSGLAYTPDSAWLAWSHPGPQPLQPDQAGPAGRRAGGGRDRGPVHRLRPGVHRGRQVPGLPVRPDLRPGV